MTELMENVSKLEIHSLTLIFAWLIFINIIAFITMGRDKKKARRGEWRTPEAKMFLQALMGGSVGCILGMIVFHHKTRKWKFRIGMPLILAVQILLVVLLFVSSSEVVFL